MDFHGFHPVDKGGNFSLLAVITLSPDHLLDALSFCPFFVLMIRASIRLSGLP